MLPDAALHPLLSGMAPGSNIFSFTAAEDKKLLAIVKPVALSLSSSQDLSLSSSLEGSGTARIDFTSYRPLWSTPFWDKYVGEFPGRNGAELVVRFCELYLNQEPRLTTSASGRPDAIVEYANKLQNLPKDVQDMLLSFVRVPVYQRELEEMQQRDLRRKELRKIFLDVFFKTTREHMRVEDRDALFVNNWEARESELWTAFYAFMFETPAYKRELRLVVDHVVAHPSELFASPELSSRAKLAADVTVKVLFQSGFLSLRDISSLVQVPVFQKVAFANRHLLIQHCPRMLSHSIVIDEVAKWLSPAELPALAAANSACRARLRSKLRLRVVAQCADLAQDVVVPVELGASCRDFLIALHCVLVRELQESNTPACSLDVFLKSVAVSQEGQFAPRDLPLLAFPMPRFEVANVDCIFASDSSEQPAADAAAGERMGEEPPWNERNFSPYQNFGAIGALDGGGGGMGPVFFEDDFAYRQFGGAAGNFLSGDEGFEPSRRRLSTDRPLSREECASLLVDAQDVDEEVVDLLTELSLADIASNCSMLEMLSEEQRRAVVDKAKAIQAGQPWPHARLLRPNVGGFYRDPVPSMDF